MAAPPRPSRQVERTLVLGVSDRIHAVLKELDAYVAPGSRVTVVGEDAESQVAVQLPNMEVSVRTGDITDRGLLDELGIPSFHQVLILAESEGRSPEMADARTLITLLHLRDIGRRAGHAVPVTTEMLDIRNQVLASVAEADDFIVSNTLVSLMLTQVAENPHLVRIFDQLFAPEGYEIYLKPADEYVVLDREVSFQQVVLSAARRGHVAIGYRVAADARRPEASYGVVVNPTKKDRRAYRRGDRGVVLAAD